MDSSKSIATDSNVSFDVQHAWAGRHSRPDHGYARVDLDGGGEFSGFDSQVSSTLFVCHRNDRINGSGSASAPAMGISIPADFNFVGVLSHSFRSVLAAMVDDQYLRLFCLEQI